MKQTKLTSELSFPTDSLLAQLVEHKTDDLEVVGSVPSRGNFFIFALHHQYWQDPATIWQKIMNYRKTRLLRNQKKNQLREHFEVCVIHVND